MYRYVTAPSPDSEHLLSNQHLLYKAHIC